MKKIKKHIEIVASTTDGLGSMSLKSRTMIKKVLERYYTNVNISIVNNLQDLKHLAEKKPDLVFVGTKKVPTEEHSSDNDEYVWLPDFLEDRSIAVTGSTSGVLKIEQDKAIAKDIMTTAGLATSSYFLARHGQYNDLSQLPLEYPLFLKPYDRGGGFGIGDDSVVRNFGEFDMKMKSLDTDSVSIVLVEKYLPGRELTVAVLQDIDSGELAVMPIEQLPVANENGDRVIGRKMKSAKAETATGAIEEGEVKQVVIDLAREAFIALGARDYGRIDIRLDENNVPHFLEANLIPSLIDGSGNFPKSFILNTGSSYDEMLLQIVNLALERATVQVPAVTPLEIASSALYA